MKDTIEKKRKQGRFYTPKIWADYAHERLSMLLGKDWYNDFVVWDNCAGTCNLTKDYKFGELYISSLLDWEVEEGSAYNKEAVHFQFDFLNDEIPNPQALFNVDTKLPEGLLDALEKNKKILFLINPPYLSAFGDMFSSTSMKNIDKKGMTASKTKEMMLLDNCGKSSNDLYVQFLYRIEKIKQWYGLSEVIIAVFSPLSYLTGSTFREFRNSFLDDFHYLGGFQFCASVFEDVSDTWSIGFTIWKSGKTEGQRERFLFDNCYVDECGKVRVEDQRYLYNIDFSVSAKDWAHDPVKGLRSYDFPNLTSALNVKDSGNERGRLFMDALGYLEACANNVAKNMQEVVLLSSVFSVAHGFGINADNFIRSTALFSARRLVKSTWKNSMDRYLAPQADENDDAWKEFCMDSVIFSLFEAKSQQSSLRKVQYKHRLWNIKNHFFFMERDEMMHLALLHGNDALYKDAENDKDRFVYLYLKDKNLSAEAQAVLDYARQCVISTFGRRAEFDCLHPEYQINNWDAGWYQIKGLLKEFFPEKLEDFKRLFNALSEKMRPMVYELGFLYR